jgi:hypothetical protein
MFYGIHKAMANLKSNDASYPKNLDSVNIITFTDGLDNSSAGRLAFDPIEGYTFNNTAGYKTFITNQIVGGGSRKIAGKSITAYSVGVAGGDVTDLSAFASSLEAIASTSGNSYVLDSFDQLEDTFEDIAKQLDIISPSTNFTLTTTLLSNADRVRMTFDVSGTSSNDADVSAKYIEGVINRSGTGTDTKYTLTNITYGGGISSDQGSGPITGKVNGSEVSFEFTDIKGYSAIVDTNAKQWIKFSLTSTWQINSEYSSTGSITPSVEKHSVIIYLVLDSSTSLSLANIDSIREAAKEFIRIMYNGYYNNP